MLGDSDGTLLGDSVGDLVGIFDGSSLGDSVGILPGVLNGIGTMVGREDVVLTEDNLPSHWHYLARGGDQCNGEYSLADARYYLAHACYDPKWITSSENYYYTFHPSNYTPNRYRSGSVGNGESVSIMQPTVFVGNLFIYAG